MITDDTALISRLAFQVGIILRHIRCFPQVEIFLVTQTFPCVISKLENKIIFKLLFSKKTQFKKRMLPSFNFFIQKGQIL